jgi:hypothetical protein
MMPRKRVTTETTTTLTDIVVPAGAGVVHEHFRRFDMHDYISVAVELGDGVSGEWVMARQDAIAHGIVPEDFGGEPVKPGKPPHPHKPEKDNKPAKPEKPAKPDDDDEDDEPDLDLPPDAPESFA